MALTTQCHVNMFQFDSVHASIYYICIRTRTVKILQAMSLLLHSGSLSLSPSLSAFLIIQNLSQYVINMWSLTVNAQHHTWYISQYTFVGASLFGCIHPLIVFLICPHLSFWEKTCIRHEEKEKHVHLLGALMDWAFSIYECKIYESLPWELTVRVYHESWLCESLPWELILWDFTIWVDCKSLPWKLTVSLPWELIL